MAVRGWAALALYALAARDGEEKSASDKSSEEKKEFLHGCLWTYRTQVELCDAQRCEKAEIMAHDFQRSVWRFYTNETNARPPLEEVFWIAVMPESAQACSRGRVDGCAPRIAGSLVRFQAPSTPRRSRGHALQTHGRIPSALHNSKCA